MDRFSECLPIILAHEGGWADHPSDPGGATMKGITIGVFAKWKGRSVTKEELRAISDAEVAAIYRRNYWDRVRAGDMPAGLDLVAFDAAVNSGVGQSAKWVQRALNVKDDGKIGDDTIEAAWRADTRSVISNACDRRLAMLRGLRTWPTFGRGWQLRVDDIRKRALDMASAPVASRPLSPKPVADRVTQPRSHQGPLAAFFAAIAALFKRGDKCSGFRFRCIATRLIGQGNAQSRVKCWPVPRQCHKTMQSWPMRLSGLPVTGRHARPLIRARYFRFGPSLIPSRAYCGRIFGRLTFQRILSAHFWTQHGRDANEAEASRKRKRCFAVVVYSFCGFWFCGARRVGSFANGWPNG